MASISKTDAAHATLSGTTVDTVAITNEYPVAEVANRAGSTTLWFTLAAGDTAGVATALAAPTAAGDNTYFVPAGTTLSVRVPDWTASEGFTVKVLGNGNDYSVTGVTE